MKNINVDELKDISIQQLLKIEDIGDTTANDFYLWMHDENNIKLLNELLQYITFKEEKKVEGNQLLLDKTFVITGDVHIYKNRKELQGKIESLGGKVTGSVSAKTKYLVNNDVESSSSKNKKAKELNIPIISEEDFEELIK